MTKRELIDKLEPFDDESEVFFSLEIAENLIEIESVQSLYNKFVPDLIVLSS